jgi:hypothetical protein
MIQFPSQLAAPDDLITVFGSDFVGIEQGMLNCEFDRLAVEIQYRVWDHAADDDVLARLVGLIERVKRLKRISGRGAKQ